MYFMTEKLDNVYWCLHSSQQCQRPECEKLRKEKRQKEVQQMGKMGYVHLLSIYMYLDKSGIIMS